MKLAIEPRRSKILILDKKPPSPKEVPNMVKKYYEKYLWLVIIVAILLRFGLAFIVMPAGDGCWHLNVARFISEKSEFPLFEKLGREVFARPPLYHILVAATYEIFGLINMQDFGLKVISPIFGSLTIFFSYLITKQIFSKIIAFWTTFFVGFIPLHIYFSSIPHIDILVSFLSLLTLFFLIKKKYLLSGISLGLAMLSKYSAPILIPLIGIWIFQNHDLKEGVKKFIFVSFVGSIVSLPWFLRNWALLGNPMWPMLRFIFGGHKAEIFTYISSGFQPLNIFTPWLPKLYLGLFGIPQGNTSILDLFPYKEILIPLWILSTIIFSLPFLFCFQKNKPKITLPFLWFSSFFLVAILFLFLDNFYPRILLPAIPAIGMFWAIGLSRIKKFKHLFIFLLIVIGIGFSVGEIVKTSYASSQWQSYLDDFKWVHENTASESLFYANSQCFSFYLERQALISYFFPNPNNLTLHTLRENQVNYIWENQNFKPDPDSALNDGILQDLDKNQIVYQNNATQTKIYKID